MPPPRLAIEAAGTHRLPVLRRGPENGRTVIFVQPLFEELNRCRRLFRDIGAALETRGIASALPDLPATGDHEELGPFSLGAAREALKAFAAREETAPLLLSVRSGVLLAPKGSHHVSIAPIRGGERILAELIRGHAIGERERTGKAFARTDAEDAWRKGETVTLTGYPITPQSFGDLSAAKPADHRQLDYGGPPVWRQADPVATADAAAHVAKQIAAAFAAGDEAQ